MNTLIRHRLSTLLLGVFVFLVTFASTCLPAHAQAPNDPQARAQMRQQLEQQIAACKQELAANPGSPFARQKLEAAQQMLKQLNGGAGGAAAPAPARKKPAPVRPDPKNPWTMPGAMWTQKSDGTYEYYRLQKDKAGRNLTIVVIPTVKADGRVVWSDKK